MTTTTTTSSSSSDALSTTPPPTGRSSRSARTTRDRTSEKRSRRSSPCRSRSGGAGMPEQVVSIRPSVRDNGIMAIDDMLCMHCGACVGTCPTNAIFLHEVYLTFNEECTQCGVFVEVCPGGALDYPRRPKLH